MKKKTLKSKLVLSGISPNLLLKDVEVTAPFLFQPENEDHFSQSDYLKKLIFYKKNLKLLKHFNLYDYFNLCMAAHWATAGTYVPTNVDNQIREGLWKHKDIHQHIDKMTQLTLESWKWDYSLVTERKIHLSTSNPPCLSTHEGTWLSVAIGAYNALKKYGKDHFAEEVAHKILEEIYKEQSCLIELREKRDFKYFLMASALVAHNLGDLDRVIDQWHMSDDDPFKKKIYKIGHRLNSDFHPLFVFSGQVNKSIMAVENHRHMSLRQAKCLRKSSHFLVPIGPFMEGWGRRLGLSDALELEDKATIIMAFFEGFKRQNMALGYTRAFRGLLSCFENDLSHFDKFLPYDLKQEIKKSQFYSLHQIDEEDFMKTMQKRLLDFKCPISGLTF